LALIASMSIRPPEACRANVSLGTGKRQCGSSFAPPADGVGRNCPGPLPTGLAEATRLLAEIIAFNQAHAGEGSMKFGQTLLVDSQAVDLGDAATAAAYAQARAEGLRISGERIDAALTAAKLDALLFSGSGSAGIGARAAYPSVAVPIGYNPDSGRPVGITLLGTAYSEARLLALAYDYEQAAAVWRPPSEINPSLFRHVVVEMPEEGDSYLPSLANGG